MEKGLSRGGEKRDLDAQGGQSKAGCEYEAWSVEKVVINMVGKEVVRLMYVCLWICVHVCNGVHKQVWVLGENICECTQRCVCLK